MRVCSFFFNHAKERSGGAAVRRQCWSEEVRISRVAAKSDRAQSAIDSAAAPTSAWRRVSVQETELFSVIRKATPTSDASELAFRVSASDENDVELFRAARRVQISLAALRRAVAAVSSRAAARAMVSRRVQIRQSSIRHCRPRTLCIARESLAF